MVTNPKTISWVNPTQGIDQSGATVAWSAAADMAGIEIQLDGTGAVSVPAAGATSFNLPSIAAYAALAAGAHTLQLAITTKEGSVSPFAAPVPFQVAVVPLAPTAVSLA